MSAAYRDPLSVVAHPCRLRILAAAGNGEFSPRVIADELPDSLGTVSYHVRAMHDAGMLRQTRTSQVGGAVAHHYQTLPAVRVLLGELNALAFRANYAATKRAST